METVFSRQRALRRRGIQNVFNILVNNSSVGGVFLILVTLFALIAANTPALSGVANIWDLKADLAIGSFKIQVTLLHWENDALMAIFLFLVGLRIKREMVVGELS